MALETARALAAKINADLKTNAVVLGSDMQIGRRYTTGDLSLDVALGGGWAANQWAEVIGLESHGKTFLVLKTIAANQRIDPDFTTFWVASEHYDYDQAQALGVDNSRVIVFATRAMEDAFTRVLAFLESGTVDCIVIDSYPALIPDEEEAKDMDEAVMALGARLTGKFFRKAGTAGHRDPTDATDRPYMGFVINQWRDNIGGWAPNGQVAKISPGGKAKNYAFWIRVEVKRDDWITEARPGKGKVIVGQTVKVKTIKNKSAAPQQVASIDLYFRDAPILGFKRGEYDEAKSIFIMGVLYDVIERKGAWYSWGEYRWQGQESALQGIRENMDLREGITEAVMTAVKNHDLDHTISDTDVAEAASTGKRRVRRRSAA